MNEKLLLIPGVTVLFKTHLFSSVMQVAQVLRHLTHTPDEARALYKKQPANALSSYSTIEKTYPSAIPVAQVLRNYWRQVTFTAAPLLKRLITWYALPALQLKRHKPVVT